MTAIAADPAGVLHRTADPATPSQPPHDRRLPRHAAAAARLRRRTAPAKPPSALDFADLDAPLIAAFLDHLEHDRGNSVRTRNARLAAIHSLFRFAALRHPEHAAVIERVLAIPTKRCDQHHRHLPHRRRSRRTARRPDRATRTGRRDHALLLLAVQTGLRASELTGLTCGDIHLGTGAHVALPRQRPQRTHHTH